MRTLYVPLISAAGLLVVGHCISVIVRDPINPQWLILAALTLLTGAFTVKIPSIPVRLSVSETFVFASVILFGTCAGTLTVALEILVVIFAGSGKKARDPLRVLFNVSSAALSIWCAGEAFYAIGGGEPFSGEQIQLRLLLLPLLALAGTYFILNSGMIAIAVGIQHRSSAFTIWRNNFLALSLNYIGGASLAALLVSYTNTVDLITLGIIIPLLFISYLTFKYSLGRVDDATKHVEEVNRLYLSTIETLATAIDAKDQVTHGHIRRVQKFALGLSAEVGITDARQLKAIEAAALLHDTGKLVVPEHILNKPARLTIGEFEKMKRHASAGADILSSINFPYPVVPIVRHHHENWDGSGYPDGLKGTDIPLGARILAVVDCFDALTSDRPYRPRLDDDDAIQILLQRRGTMYDPLIVDTFVVVKDKLAETFQAAESQVEALVATQRWRTDVGRTSDISGALRDTPEVEKLLLVLAQSLIQSTSARIVILFITDIFRDEMRSLFSFSREGRLQLEVAMPVGARVTGWVAANGTAISNADATLDLPDQAKSFGLNRCLCVPVSSKLEQLAVVSLYTDDPRGFSERDSVVVDAAIKSIDLRGFREFLSALAKSTPSRGKQAPTVH
jgi:putative nucleotidyltransferase with HDIG domain